MSYPARVFRILIASPSDVVEEREIAVKTIQEWNDLNSPERQLVLLPLRWETHSAPEYGKRPQEVINRQIVDHCDLLIGVFWTRIGSPTGVADSGTLEEIERVAKQGKPVMLYFSQAKEDPERIDIDQLKKLREFKQKTFPKALIETYASAIEFRDKLAKQIEIQLRVILAEQSEQLAGGPNPKPITDIQVGFADIEKGTYLGAEIALETTLLEVEGLDRLPDYGPKQALNVVNSEKGIFTFNNDENRNYYRDLVSYYVRKNFFRPIRLWMKNVGALGARDCYVDIRITSVEGETTVSSISQAGLSAPSKSSNIFLTSWHANDQSDIDLLHHGNQWNTYFELRALQPQREVSPPARFVIGSNKSGPVTVVATIYADTLPEPIIRTLRIDWKVNHAAVHATELLRELQGAEIATVKAKASNQ
jgi:nucleoside 2-deoxyribosyltransferase